MKAGATRPRAFSQWASGISRSCSPARPQSSQRNRINSSARDDAPTTSEFGAFFAEQWVERWPSLSAALTSPTAHCALLNTFVPGAGPTAQAALREYSQPLATPAPMAALMSAASTAPQGYLPPERDADTGLLPWYWLDPASLLPPLALGVRPGHRVLDLCAAPGGKSLVLASLLFGVEDAELGIAAAGDPALTCNEVDAKRRMRLLGVLRQYLPADLLQRVKVTGRDGAAWPPPDDTTAPTFDRILIDAPCSSDRHVAQQKGIDVPRSDWNVQRCRVIAKTQARLLTAAVRALAVGGTAVYSTCSIADLENDGVVDKVLERAGGAVEAATELPPGAAALAAAAGAERSRHGWIVLPDAGGWGPIYFSILQKTAPTDMKRVKENKYAAAAGGGGARRRRDP